MTRQEALQHVAEHLVGHLNGSAPDEIYETDDSRSEAKIDWAMREIARRLSDMGQPRRKAE